MDRKKVEAARAKYRVIVVYNNDNPDETVDFDHLSVAMVHAKRESSRFVVHHTRLYQRTPIRHYHFTYEEIHRYVNGVEKL